MIDALKEMFGNLFGGENPVENVQQQAEEAVQNAGEQVQNVQDQAAQAAEDVKSNLPGQQ